MGRREVHLDVGDFDVTLDEATPRELVPDMDSAYGGFALFVVTPGRVPYLGMSISDLLAFSIYTGVIREAEYASDDTVKVAGAGSLILGGDEDSKGDDPIDTSGGATITTRPFHDGANTSVVNAFISRAQGITKHSSIPSAATPTASYHVDEGATGLDILRAGARGAFSTWREFYLDHALALHADVATALYRAGHAVLTADIDGPAEDERWGIPADLQHLADLEDWTSRVVVNNGGAIQGDADIATNPYYAPDGDPLALQRTIASQAPPNNTGAGRVATTQLGRFSAAARTINVRTSARGVCEHVRPGDWLHAYAPQVQLVGDGTTVYDFGGRTITPVTGLRCASLRSANEAGSGFYMVVLDGRSQPFVDWSDHVIPENPGADIEVGQITRSLGYQPLAKATT